MASVTRKVESWIDSLHPQIALRAIDFADVRFGILPAQWGSVRNRYGQPRNDEQVDTIVAVDRCDTPSA